MNGTHCPSCNNDIGILAVVKATLPTRIKCPHCKMRLMYTPIPWIQVIISIILYIAVLVLALSFTSTFKEVSEGMIIIIEISIIILLWQPFEFYISTYLRKNCHLNLK